MPIFEYQCADCGVRSEHLQLSSDSALEACPECGGKVAKLLSAPAFQFKGSGWYVTDYAGKNKDGGGNGASDSSAKSATDKDSGDAKKGGKVESKSAPAKATETKTSSPSD